MRKVVVSVFGVCLLCLMSGCDSSNKAVVPKDSAPLPKGTTSGAGASNKMSPGAPRPLPPGFKKR
jgi:hypothetical protein